MKALKKGKQIANNVLKSNLWIMELGLQKKSLVKSIKLV